MRAFLFALLLLIGASCDAVAEEHIVTFDSDATVNVDGSLAVRETIVYEFHDIGSKHGIFRDFPTHYRDANGSNYNVGFDVQSVNRDGQPEPFQIENISNGKRVRIGSRDVYLDEGRHRYEIAYTTTRQLGFFADADELYWNVTGNQWPFIIESARAVIRLPPGASIIRSAAYTGQSGTQGQNFHIISAKGSVFEAVTTQRLYADEGFTVAVGFTKGIVAAPSGSERWAWFLSDNGALIGMLLCIFLVGAYYLYAWTRVGRDPPAGVIVPLFSPPAPLGPAGVRYVWRQSFDDKAFASGLVGLAVKKRARIYDDDDSYAVEKLNQQGPALTTSEAVLYNAMSGGRQELKQTNYVNVRSMRSALQNALTREFDGVAFLNNQGWFWIGLLVSVVLMVVAVFLFLPAEEAFAGVFMVMWAGIWWSVVLFAMWSVFKGFWHSSFTAKLGSVFGFLFLIPFVFGGVGGPIAMLAEYSSWGLYGLAATAVILGIMNIVFFGLLRAPTIEGRKLLDQIEGFRMYLSTAEEDRLNQLHPPEKTPELFERYLPYALALDCENEWGERFESVLSAAGAAPPTWYAGNRWSSSNMGGFTRSVGSSLAAATASSHTAPGSRSGSSGGGSSGGGGGGGGGGSW